MALNGPGLRDRQRAAAYRLDHVYSTLLRPAKVRELIFSRLYMRMVDWWLHGGAKVPGRGLGAWAVELRSFGVAFRQVRWGLFA